MLQQEKKKNPAILLLGIYLKKPKKFIRKDICIHLFIAAFFRIAKIQKQHKYLSIDRWIKKKWCIYTVKYLSALKREWNIAISNSMEGPRVE